MNNRGQLFGEEYLKGINLFQMVFFTFQFSQNYQLAIAFSSIELARDLYLK